MMWFEGTSNNRTMAELKRLLLFGPRFFLDRDHTSPRCYVWYKKDCQLDATWKIDRQWREAGNES
jgi:hypothetical protein